MGNDQLDSDLNARKVISRQSSRAIMMTKDHLASCEDALPYRASLI